MKRFLTRKELKVKRKEMIYMVIGIAVILSLYYIFTREMKHRLCQLCQLANKMYKFSVNM